MNIIETDVEIIDACDMCGVFSTVYTVDIGGIFVSMCPKCLEHYNE